MLVESKGKRFR